MQAIEGHQYAGFLQRFVVSHHRFDGLGVRHRSRRGVLIALGDHQHHESHRLSPVHRRPKFTNWPKDAGEPLTSTNSIHSVRESADEWSPRKAATRWPA